MDRREIGMQTINDAHIHASHDHGAINLMPWYVNSYSQMGGEVAKFMFDSIYTYIYSKKYEFPSI